LILLSFLPFAKTCKNHFACSVSMAKALLA
jgi:hypothetical protein